VNRIILNAGSGTSTIASNGTNVLQFDTTIGVTPLIRQDGGGAFVISHPIELTASNLQLGGSGGGKVTLSGAIGGPGELQKIGTATFELAGPDPNTFTGQTTVSAGTLIANKSAGVDAVPGNLTIETGGTVELAAADQLQGNGSGAMLALNGGTLRTGAAGGFGDTLGVLDLGASSTIDLGTGPHTIRFINLNPGAIGTLSILDWAGTPNSAGTAGRIEFDNLGNDPNTDFAAFLSIVQFQSFGNGATFITTGTSGVYELVPVPEPGTVLTMAFGALAAGAALRRRRFTVAPTGPAS
jgi:autotransporter-associated beta strand protein